MPSAESPEVTLLHPGEMGASIGAALVSQGAAVRWVSGGRSTATARRADDAGLIACDELPEALHQAQLVISVVPPANALDVAAEVAEAGYAGRYLDANAVSPQTMAALVQAAPGVEVVDGGIVGPPARQRGQTRLALSGPSAEAVAQLFDGSLVEPVVVGDHVGMASAFKQSFAAFTKGSSALVLAIDAYADAHGVGDAIRREWATRGMTVEQQIEGARHNSVPKGWRFDGEMDEIAAAWLADGIPAGFFEGAAEVYRRLAHFKDRFDDPPSLQQVRDDLRRAP